MAREAFVTEAKAKRIINALHASGITIESVTIKADGVTLHTTSDANHNSVSAVQGLPDDWSTCPFEAQANAHKS